MSTVRYLKASKAKINIEMLPTEMIIQVIEYLDLEAALNLSRVSPSLHWNLPDFFSGNYQALVAFKKLSIKHNLQVKSLAFLNQSLESRMTNYRSERRKRKNIKSILVGFGSAALAFIVSALLVAYIFFRKPYMAAFLEANEIQRQEAVRLLYASCQKDAFRTGFSTLSRNFFNERCEFYSVSGVQDALESLKMALVEYSCDVSKADAYFSACGVMYRLNKEISLQAEFHHTSIILISSIVAIVAGIGWGCGYRNLARDSALEELKKEALSEIDVSDNDFLKGMQGANPEVRIYDLMDLLKADLRETQSAYDRAVKMTDAKRLAVFSLFQSRLVSVSTKADTQSESEDKIDDVVVARPLRRRLGVSPRGLS